MRFAKLEIKAILALFLTRYEYELVDADGAAVTTLPAPERDNMSVHVNPLYVQKIHC